MRILFVVLRVVIALAIAAAVLGQLATSLFYWDSIAAEPVWILVMNFFSFFTIQSNLLALAVLLIGAVTLSLRRQPSWFPTLRTAATTYMFVTGVVYNMLLRDIELPQGATLDWSNEIVHAVAPLYLLLDFLFAPDRTPLLAKKLWVILIFPLAWLAYTLIRGPFTPDIVFGAMSWYPYPFLNPDTSANGYLSVAFYIVLISAVIGLAAAGLLWVSRRRPRVAARG